MAPYKIVCEWIDFNPTLETDIYRVTALDATDTVVYQRECTLSKLPNVVAEVVNV